MRVINRCCSLRLPDEPIPKRFIRRQGRCQDLQRNPPLETLIARPEDYRHPAGADSLFQVVVSESRDRGKANWLSIGLSWEFLAHYASRARQLSELLFSIQFRTDIEGCEIW